MKPMMDFEPGSHGPGVVLDTDRPDAPEAYSEFDVAKQAWEHWRLYYQRLGQPDAFPGTPVDKLCKENGAEAHGTELVEDVANPVICSSRVGALVCALNSMAHETRYTTQNTANAMLLVDGLDRRDCDLTDDQRNQKTDILRFKTTLLEDADRYSAMATQLNADFIESFGKYAELKNM